MPDSVRVFGAGDGEVIVVCDVVVVVVVVVVRRGGWVVGDGSSWRFEPHAEVGAEIGGGLVLWEDWMAGGFVGGFCVWN